MQTYTVLPGDTLYGISKQFGVSVDDIRKANNIYNDAISIGQIINIPSSSNSSVYVVKSGDTLYSIAKIYGTTVNDIVNSNNLSSSFLSIGQQLIIPKSSSNQTPSFTYTIKRGDTLYSIANMFNTSVNEIKRLNNLTSNFLSIGQILKIPTIDGLQIPVNYRTYVVKRGDSLYAIANRYNMTVSELMRLNNLNSSTLSIGQLLKVKNVAPNTPSVVKECFGQGYMEPTYQTYIVKRGDSLYIIANKFCTSVDNLIRLNNLKSNNLQIGQILKIKEINQ